MSVRSAALSGVESLAAASVAVALLDTPVASGGGLLVPLATSLAFPNAATTEFDLIVVAGQSNNFHGAGLDTVLDRTANLNVASIPRYPHGASFNAANAVYAVAPLENEGYAENGVDPTMTGYGMALASNLLTYDPTLLSATGRKVLLYQHATGGTGFSDPTTQSNWNKSAVANGLYKSTSGTSALYDNLVAILKALPRAQLRALVWDQGEEDYATTWSTGSTYPAPLRQTWLDFFAQVRSDFSTPDLPIVVTTLSEAPGWNGTYGTYTQRNTEIAAFPSFQAFTALSDDRAGGQTGVGTDTFTGSLGFNDEPFGVTDDPTHFSRATQVNYRSFRILKAMRAAETANNPGGTASAVSVPGAITDLSVVSSQSGALTLSWTANGGSGPSNGGGAIRGIEAQVSTDSGTTWGAAPARLGSGRVLAGLSNGQTYKVRIRPYNVAGPCPTWSNVVTGTPAAINMAAGLKHDLAAVVSSSSVVDRTGNATLTAANLTYANDGIADAANFTSNVTSYVKTTGGTISNPVSFGVSLWCSIASFGSSKGFVSEWTGTTEQWSLYQATISGANTTIKSGPGTAGGDMVGTVAQATLLNIVCHYAFVCDDDGSGNGTDRYRLWINGALVVTKTAVARRTPGTAWSTGTGSSGTTNSAPGPRSRPFRIQDMAAWLAANPALSAADWVANLYAAGEGA